MANQTAKELFANLFRKRKVSRPPFIPWVSAFAARLEQIPVRKAFSDATSMSRSLQNCQKLYGYDGIGILFDQTLEAEACGCEIAWDAAKGLPAVIKSLPKEGAAVERADIVDIEKKGRVPVVLEAVKRIKMLKGNEIPILGIITGPLTLARLLRPDLPALETCSQETTDVIELAKKVTTRLCKAFCEQGVDAVVIAEKMLGTLGADLIQPVMAPILTTLCNVTKYYNIYSILLTGNCNEEQVEPIFQLQADGMVVSGSVDYEQVIEAATKYHRCLGLSISCSETSDAQTELRRIAKCRSAMNKGGGVFLSTEWEVAYDTPVAYLHEMMKGILFQE
jgi:uroporphyrinogen decarboxylase